MTGAYRKCPGCGSTLSIALDPNVYPGFVLVPVNMEWRDRQDEQMRLLVRLLHDLGMPRHLERTVGEDQEEYGEREDAGGQVFGGERQANGDRDRYGERK